MQHWNQRYPLHQLSILVNHLIAYMSCILDFNGTFPLLLDYVLTHAFFYHDGDIHMYIPSGHTIYRSCEVFATFLLLLVVTAHPRSKVGCIKLLPSLRPPWLTRTTLGTPQRFIPIFIRIRELCKLTWLCRDMPGGCALRLRCVLRVLRPEAEFEIWVSSSFRRDDDKHTSFLCHLPTLLGSNNRDLRPQIHMSWWFCL